MQQECLRRFGRDQTNFNRLFIASLAALQCPFIPSGLV